MRRQKYYSNSLPSQPSPEPSRTWTVKDPEVRAHIRKRTDPAHPETGITTPCKNRRGWCIDWYWFAIVAVIVAVLLL
jgi:hypothetical protein